MPVPEAAMHEYHLAAPGENDIRMAGEPRPVKSKSIAEGMNEAPDEKLRFAVLAADSRHALAAGGWRKRIHSREAPLRREAIPACPLSVEVYCMKTHHAHLSCPKGPARRLRDGPSHPAVHCAPVIASIDAILVAGEGQVTGGDMRYVDRTVRSVSEMLTALKAQSKPGKVTWFRGHGQQNWKLVRPSPAGPRT